MNIDFNNWWDEDDLTTQGNPFTDSTPAYWAWEGWCAGVKAERQSIAMVFEDNHEVVKHRNNYWLHAANYVRARSNT